MDIKGAAELVGSGGSAHHVAASTEQRLYGKASLFHEGLKEAIIVWPGTSVRNYCLHVTAVTTVRVLPL